MHKRENKEDEATKSFEFVKQKCSSTTTESLLNNWPLMSSIILFCIVSFEDMAYSEVRC